MDEGRPRETPPAPAHPALGAERRMRLPVAAAVLVSLVVAPARGNWFTVAVDLAAWAVLVADLLVHLRRIPRFLRTGLGHLSLAVTVVTAPWYLLPDLGSGKLIVVARLLLSARLVAASRRGRQLAQRLGSTAAVALVLVLVSVFTAYFAEHAHNPGFRTVGDALWWGMVTFTGTGYGDITPVTATGRWAGVCIMVVGVVVIGVLAGALSGFYRSRPPDRTPD